MTVLKSKLWAHNKSKRSAGRSTYYLKCIYSKHIHWFALLTLIEGTWTRSGCAIWNKDAFDKHISTNQLQQQVKAEEYEHYLCSAIPSVNSTVFTPLHFYVMRESLWSLQTLSSGQKGRRNRFNCCLVSAGRSGWHPGGLKHVSLLGSKAKCVPVAAPWAVQRPAWNRLAALLGHLPGQNH